MSHLIEVYENMLSEELCKQIINTHNHSEHVTPGRTGSGVDKKLKDSLDVGMHSDAQWQPFIQPVLAAIQTSMREYFKSHPAALVSGITPMVNDPATGKNICVNIDNFDPVGLQYIDQITGYLFRYTGLTVQKYKQQQGGYHYWHSEIYPQDQHNEPLHRQLAILLYLNDVEEGGETEFFYQGVKTRPKPGSVVIFPSGFTHTHKGHIPVSGDKYVITAWLLFNRSEQLFKG